MHVVSSEQCTNSYDTTLCEQLRYNTVRRMYAAHDLVEDAVKAEANRQMEMRAAFQGTV